MRLAYRPLKRYGEQFLSLDGKLHRQFLQHLLRIAIDDEHSRECCPCGRAGFVLLTSICCIIR